MSATPVLALRDVSKSFGSIEVLHGVTLALEPGTVHALIGDSVIAAGSTNHGLGQRACDGNTIERHAGAPHTYGIVSHMRHVFLLCCSLHCSMK